MLAEACRELAQRERCERYLPTNCHYGTAFPAAAAAGLRPRGARLGRRGAWGGRIRAAHRPQEQDRPGGGGERPVPATGGDGGFRGNPSGCARDKLPDSRGSE